MRGKPPLLLYTCVMRSTTQMGQQIRTLYPLIIRTRSPGVELGLVTAGMSSLLMICPRNRLTLWLPPYRSLRADLEESLTLNLGSSSSIPDNILLGDWKVEKIDAPSFSSPLNAVHRPIFHFLSIYMSKQPLFCKRPEGKYFRLVSHMGSVTTTHFCCSIKQ